MDNLKMLSCLKNIFLLILALLCSTNLLLGQSAAELSNMISDCDGSVKISRSGNFTLQFPGNAGVLDDLAYYPNLTRLVKETNVIWVSFEAPYDGELTFSAFSTTSPVSMVVFGVTVTDACTDIYEGRAEILRFLHYDDADTIGLSQQMSERFLAPLKMKEGEIIKIYFNATEIDDVKCDLKFKFLPTNIERVKKNMTKLVDMQTDTRLPKFEIHLRDKDTGLPVDGQIILSGGRMNNGMYVGSDFIFTNNSRAAYNIAVDAEGYFFYDLEERLDGESAKVITIEMEPAYAGKKLYLPGIQFKMGTNELIEEAYSQLRRLRDFLILNAEIKIEIQGHVHNVGEDVSFVGKKLSQSRAKTVYKYLVNSGIDKNRLSYQGYGNEFMKYPEPKNLQEEQANRRVEILVLKEKLE
ncbi:MAG: OmpA family protein [Crocinitomicaceae bacterium]|nr:OmpA family protein [Crocinitomicaceae bacterium]